MFKKLSNTEFVWAILRISIGLIFLWAFFDKAFGLNYATKTQDAWIHGKSPTYDYLTYSTRGPLKMFYQSLAGIFLIDLIFMLGLFKVGLSMLLGIGTKITGYIGSAMLMIMWTASFPPTNHPFIDEHVIYSIIMIGLTTVDSGHWLGIGKWWEKTRLVKRFPWLR